MFQHYSNSQIRQNSAESDDIWISFILFLNIFFTCLNIFICFSFRERNNYKEIIIFGFYIGITAIVFFLILVFYVILKIWTIHHDKKYKTAKLEQCKRDLLIGYGGIAVCEIIPQIIVLYVGESYYFMISYAFLGMSTNIILFLLFILQHKSSYKLKRDPSGEKSYVSFNVGLFHILYIIIVSYFTYGKWNQKDFDAVFACFLWFALFYAASTTEFLSILVRDIDLKSTEQNGTNQLTESLNLKRYASTQERPTRIRIAVVNEEVFIPISEDINSKSNGLECNVCMLEYSNQVIPRILIGCGHTVCEECVGNLIKNRSELISCPFCRKATNVPDGVPSQLPKNYAILEMIQKRTTGST